MSNSKHITTVLIGGQAGDGIKKAGINLGRLLAELGQEVFISIDYQSLVKGGHNFSRISFSTEKVFNDYQSIDLLIALNQESISLHQKELKNGGVIFSESPVVERSAFTTGRALLPMTEFVEEVGSPLITRTSIALGAICYYFDIDIKKLENIFKEIFKAKAEPNIFLSFRY